MLFRVATAAALSSTIACGEVNSDTADAALADAPLVDASEVPDAAPALIHHRYVIDRLVLPRTSTDDVRLDIDGDGDAENKLSAIIGTVSSQTQADMAYLRQADIDRGIDRGQVILLLDIESRALDAADPAYLRTLEGTSAMPAPCAGGGDNVCRRHLAGSASFAIAAASPASSRVSGTIVDGAFRGGNGALVLKVPAGGGRAVSFNLAAARVELGAVTATGIRSGLLGGAMLPSDFLAEAVPLLEEAIRIDVTTHCSTTVPPGCGCTAGSIGQTYLELLDMAPEDCRVSQAEIRSNSLVTSLMAPDLDVAPVDGTPESLSVVFAVTAVPATWPDAP